MDIDAALRELVVFGQNVYRPTVLPMDYGGSTVCQVSLTLADGRCLFHSSFELPSLPVPEEQLLADTVGLLRRDLAALDTCPRCDHLDAPATKAYRERQGLAQPSWAVSACLCGQRCRYDGDANLFLPARELFLSGQAIPVCPECAGGLPTPRPPCEIQDGRVMDCHGADRTAAFLSGAKISLATVRTFGISRALLKERSPSCGTNCIYDGSFSGKRIGGSGIFAAMLRRSGVRLESEETASFESP